MSYIGAQPTTAAFVTDTFSANGSGTVFTLSVAPANTNSILVAVSGVLQDPSTYSVSGTTLTFSAAPPAGTGNISVRFLGIPASGVTTTAYRTVTEFTATAGQTTFTPPSYTVGYINVYRNGALLGTADYTATNGTTVVLASAASSGDLVVVESFLVSSVLNAIPNGVRSVNTSNLPVGTVLQVVQGSLTTTVAISNTAQGALTDVGLSATITPTSSTSKILVMVTFGAVSANSNDFAFHLIRGSTEIGQSTTAASGSNGTGILGTTGAQNQMPIPAAITYLDSPATTSSTTYKMQVNNTNGSAQTVNINRRNSDTTYTMASYITLMEIAA